MSNWTRIIAILLAVVLIAVTLLPVDLSTTGDGILSISLRQAEANPDWLSGWSYRKQTTNGAQSNYPMKVMLQDGLCARYVDAGTDGAPNNVAQVFAVVNNCLYWGRNYNLDTTNYHGDFYKTDLQTGETTNILADIYAFAAFEAITVGDYIYVAGQAAMSGQSYPYMALTIWRIDTTDDSITSAQLDEGDADHEFIGIDTDGTNLYLGTIAGEIWKVPISTWSNSATWVKKWTDPNGYFASYLVYWAADSKVYVYMNGDNRKWRVVSSLASNLTSWSDELDYTSQTTGYHNVGHLAVCGSTLVCLGAVESGTNWHMFKFTGSSWTDYDLAISLPSENSGLCGIWLPDESKLMLSHGLDTTLTHTVYTVTLTNTNKTTECSGLQGTTTGFLPRTATQVAYQSSYYYISFIGSAPAFVSRASRPHSLEHYNDDDFSDLRFTKSDGTTVLPCLFESVTSGVSATIWVNVNSANIIVYFGNTGVGSQYATPLLAGEATFSFFDDFEDGGIDTNKWFHWIDNGSESESGGVFALIGGSGTYNAWGAKTKLGTNYAYRGRVKVSSETLADVNIFGIDDRSDDGTYEGSDVDQAAISDGGIIPYKRFLNNREGTATTVERVDALTSFATVEIQRNASTNVKYLMGNALKATISANVPTDNCGLIVWANSAVTVYWDLVLVRKYTYPEPAFGTWGGEQTFTVEITNTPGTNNFGILGINTTGNTAINYFTVENTGTCNVDVVIYGTDLTGGDDTWDLADSGTPSENIYGLYAGLDDADDTFDVIVRETETYNTLLTDLAEDATQDWGLKIYMPTSVTGYDAQQMSGTVTLVASES